MSSGHIYVAEQDDVYIIRLIGDVRLTLCVSFDQFIAAMFAEEELRAVIFDLREAEGIDSTTLGLIAKISIGAKQRGFDVPVAVVNDPSIRRLLISMGFDDILRMVQEVDVPDGDPVRALPEFTADESAVRERILEAHRILMEMHQPNKTKFKELVETLQNKR